MIHQGLPLNMFSLFLLCLLPSVFGSSPTGWRHPAWPFQKLSVVHRDLHFSRTLYVPVSQNGKQSFVPLYPNERSSDFTAPGNLPAQISRKVYLAKPKGAGRYEFQESRMMPVEECPTLPQVHDAVSLALIKFEIASVGTPEPVLALIQVDPSYLDSVMINSRFKKIIPDLITLAFQESTTLGQSILFHPQVVRWIEGQVSSRFALDAATYVKLFVRLLETLPEEVLDFPIPKTVTQLQSFLGPTRHVPQDAIRVPRHYFQNRFNGSHGISKMVSIPAPLTRTP